MNERNDLSSALERLVKAGGDAGLDGSAVREEGARLAAAVAESATGAGLAWNAQIGQSSAKLDAFFDAASSARRWRAAPTDLLGALVANGSPAADEYAKALTGVIAAASELGEPSMSVISAASVTAAAQLAATATRPTLSSAVIGDTPGDPVAAFGHHFAFPALADPSSPSGVSATTAAAAPPVEKEKKPTQPEKTLDELMAELDELIGLEAVKTEIHRQTQLLRIDQLRSAAGLTTPTLTRHLVFLGNPGTGKTTVARLVSGIYRALGILPKGHLVEVDRSELVAGYLGQTASKTSEVIAKALGGVLFIDEAYGLASDQYGSEAVTTLVKEMEDHRDELVVIVAGYPEPMQAFMDTNPGVASRFSTEITFADYSDAELRQIFERLATSADFEPSPECLVRFEEIVSVTPRDEGFGNGRYARNLLDAAIARHAWRLRDVAEPSIDQLRILLPEDLNDTDAPRVEEPVVVAKPATSDPEVSVPEPSTSESSTPAPTTEETA